MTIDDLTYKVTIGGNMHYYVVAKDVEEATKIVRQWRPSEMINEITLTNNLTLTRDIIKKMHREEIIRNGSCG